MIPDEVAALALADAIGALDPDERKELETRLARLSSDARLEVARLYDVTFAIAASVEGASPSPAVREQLLAKINAATAHTASATFTVRAAAGEWLDTPFRGVRMKILSLDRDRNRVMMLLRGEPGARYPAHRHSAPEECYVISGSVIIEGQRLVAGDFHHAEGDTQHGEIRTEEGTEVLLVAAASDYLP